MRRLWKWLVGFLLLLLVFYLLLQTSWVQTKLTGWLSNSLTEELGIEVQVGRVDIDFFSALVLEDISVLDRSSDTLLTTDRIGLSGFIYQSSRKQIQTTNIELERPAFYLRIAKGDSITNLDHIINQIPASTSTDSTDFLILLDKLTINDGIFGYRDENIASTPNNGTMQYHDILASNIDLQAHNVCNLGDSVNVDVRSLSLSERSGLTVNELSTALALNESEIQADHLTLQTGHSTLNGDLGFSFDSWSDFSDFNNKIKLDAVITESEIESQDIGYFTESLAGLQEAVSFTGEVKGSIANLKGRDLDIRFGNHSRIEGRLDMTGLPNIEETFIQLDVNRLVTNKSDLELLPIPPFDSDETLPVPDNIKTLGDIVFKGNFTGFVTDFVAYGTLNTALGSITSDIQLASYDGETSYAGSVQTTGFDLQRFYSEPILGELACDLKLEGTGVTIEDIDAEVKGSVGRLDLNGYTYQDIAIDGQVKNSFFNGFLGIEDERANFTFDGSIDFTSRKPKFDFLADVKHLDLVQLNFLDNQYTSVSGALELNGEGNNLDDFIGHIVSDDIVICTIDQDFPIDHLEIHANRNKTQRRIQLSSSIADALLVGEFDTEGLTVASERILADIIPSYPRPTKKVGSENFDLYLTLRDFDLIQALFIPDLHISPGASVILSMDDQNSDFSGLFTADTVRYQTYEATEFLIDVSHPDSSLYFTLMSDQLQLSDSLKINLLNLDARSEKDTIFSSLSWGHIDDALHGNLENRLVLEGGENGYLQLDQASIWVNDRDWNLADTAYVRKVGQNYGIENFELRHKDQFISMNGSISEDPDEQLRVGLSDYDLSMLDPLLVNAGIRLNGRTSGDIVVNDVYGDPLINTNLDTQQLKIDEYLIGDVRLESDWDQSLQQLNTSGALEKNGKTAVEFSGSYTPSDEESPLLLNAYVDDAELDFLNAFITEGISGINGTISGDVEVTGKLESPQLQGGVDFNGASVHVDYLSTTYFFEEGASIHPDWFGLDGIHVYDEENNMALLTGTIVHENFADWNFDVFLDMEEEDFLVLSTTEEENNLYYGKAYVTGYAGVFGYADNLEIDVNVKSEKGTTIALPLGGTEEVQFGNFVTFVDFSDPVEEEIEVDLTGIDLNLELDITPDAEMRIIFDEAVGDEIKGRGKGHLNMVINNLSTFNMYGTVEVVEGNYLFTLKNLINKEFGVVPGGTISWFGDPFEAVLDLKAVYKLTAPLYDLMAEDAEQYRQRVPVELMMNLSDGLMNPNIHFDIDLPTSNEITKTRVRSAISTEEEMNRQAFALLVLRRFISPPNISKSHNNNGLAENSTELLSSQLSNWLSQISNDFDVGVNYRPGDEISNEELAVALSTQLFNDRLRVSGNFGLAYGTGTQTQAQANNVIGDLQIEWKILENGKIRLVVYNQSNDYDITRAANSNYTQGVGVIFQEEFNTLYELFDLKEK